jgi:hypothetical protein
MIWSNIFRTPNVAVTKGKQMGEDTFSEFGDNIDGGDDKICIEEAWPHLQVIYELLLRIIIQK